MNLEVLIGQTPLVQLAPNLFVKLEYTNMTGSVKDRAALEMVLDAEKRGILKPGGIIIEPTSGNTGIALAAIGAAKGYRVMLVMPDSMSVERQKMMTDYGAEVILTPGALGMSGAVEKAQALVRELPDAWMAAQFDNPANAMAHYRTTGPEIWEQTTGKIDIFVAGVGTGGTITGTGRYLKEQKSIIRLVAVEPAGSPLLSQGRAGKHGLQGIGANFVPSVLDVSLLDDIRTVTEEQAYAAARRLAAEKDIFCGISSGAALSVAEIIAQENPDKMVVTLLPDSGNRYLSTGLY